MSQATIANKIVAVLGATGVQGGSIVETLLARGTYKVRALTRDTASPAAKALASKGTEVMHADLADKASLVSAFTSAYAVFGVTMPFAETSEVVQGQNIADACKECNIDLLIWSSLPNVSAASGGKYTKVKHFDEKAAVDEYIKQVGQPAVIMQLGNFSENMVKFHQLQPSSTEPGAFDYVYPVVRSNVRVPHTWIEADLGHVVCAIVDNWEDAGIKAKLTKEAIPVCSFSITGEETVAAIKRITGKTVNYVNDTPTYGGEAASEALLEVYQWVDEGGFYEGVAFPTALFVEMGVKFSTFDDYVKKVLALLLDNMK